MLIVVKSAVALRRQLDHPPFSRFDAPVPLVPPVGGARQLLASACPLVDEVSGLVILPTPICGDLRVLRNYQL